MRKVFSETIYKFLHKDKKIVVLLGDIGVYSFSKVNNDSASNFSENVEKLAISENNIE